MFARTCNNLSHDIGSSVCAGHIIHVSCGACVFDLSSTLFAPFICLSHLLLHPPDLLLSLPCGCCWSKIPCALRPLRSLALWPMTPLSQVEEGPPLREGQCMQNSVEANPPGSLCSVKSSCDLLCSHLECSSFHVFFRSPVVFIGHR